MVCILVVRKLLFFTFIRNRIVSVLREKCGKTRESPCKISTGKFWCLLKLCETFVGFSLMY